MLRVNNCMLNNDEIKNNIKIVSMADNVMAVL